MRSFLFLLFAVAALQSCKQQTTVSSSTTSTAVTPTTASANTPTPANVFAEEVKKHLDAISDQSSGDSDTLTMTSTKLFNTISKNKDLIFTLPDTLDCGLSIAKSADKNFCLLSWDTRQGGTLKDFANVAVYKSGGKTFASILNNKDAEGLTVSYDTIFTIAKTDKSIVYLANGNGQISNIEPVQSLDAFQITGESANFSKLFPKNKTGAFTNFNVRELKEEQEVPDIEIKDGGKTIRVPQLNDKGGFDKKYITLIFNGQSWVEKK